MNRQINNYFLAEKLYNKYWEKLSKWTEGVEGLEIMQTGHKFKKGDKFIKEGKSYLVTSVNGSVVNCKLIAKT